MFLEAPSLPLVNTRSARFEMLTMLFALVLAVPLFAQGQNRDNNPRPRQGKVPAAQDPGPRGAPIGAGGPVANLSPDQLRFFNDAAQRFVNAEGVADGLGPTFNAD